MAIWDSRWFDESRGRRRHYEAYAVFIIIIIAILMVISIYRSESTSVKRSVCAQRLVKLIQAFHMYASDYGDHYPPGDNWPRLLVKYIDTADEYFCPADNQTRVWYKKHPDRNSILQQISYWYRPVETNSADTPNPPVCGDRMYSNFLGNHEDGGNIAFLDGHVRWFTISQWEKNNLPTQPLSTKSKQ